MKALVLESPRNIVLKEVAEPRLLDGWVRVKPLAVSICGSDYHSYRGGNKLISYPRVLGHEVSGTVIETKGDTGFSIDDFVILMPYLSCGVCRPCLRGKANCCDHLSVYGVHRDGALAENFVAPASQLIKVPADMDPVEAALVEPLAISTHAVMRSDVRASDRVLVLGGGPIGLGAALMSRVHGADVVIADISEKRRDFLTKKFHFARVLDPMAADYQDQLLAWSRGELADIVIDSTGSAASMSTSYMPLRHGGRVVWVGISGTPVALDGTAFHVRETELYDSRAAYRSDFEQVLFAIEHGLVNRIAEITHTATFDEAAEAFRQWEALGGEVFKAVIKMA